MAYQMDHSLFTDHLMHVSCKIGKDFLSLACPNLIGWYDANSKSKVTHENKICLKLFCLVLIFSQLKQLCLQGAGLTQ